MEKMPDCLEPHRDGAISLRISKPTRMPFLLVAAMAAAVLLIGCQRQKEGEEAVAWVNGEPILFSVFWDEIKNRYNEVEEAASPQEDVLRVLKTKVLTDLIRERLLLQEASKRGITVSDEALADRIEKIKEGYDGGPFRKSLIKHAMDYDEWRRQVRKTMIMEALFAAVTQEAGKVSDEDVARYYKDHRDEFLIPEAVELNQIVVKNRATAQRLLRRIHRGENFGALAARYSIGPEKEEKGRLGTFQRGQLPKPLEEAAFSTPPGKVTSIVETRHGFHLLQVVRRIPSHVQTEDEAREEIAAKLSRERQERFYDKWVEQLIQHSDIRVHASLVQLAVKKEPPKPLPFKHEEGRAIQ